MRLISFIIALICLMPILLVFGGWVFPLSEAGVENWRHIRSTVLPDYILGSSALILLVALLAGSMGATSAWLVTRYDFPFRNYLAWMLVLPFAMPSYILAMTYGNLLEFAGPVQNFIRDMFGLSKGDYFFPQIRSLPGAAFLISLATFPYVYLMGRAAFEAQTQEWNDLAKLFGHTKLRTVIRLSFGAARPFLMLGIALAIMEAAADIGVTQLFGVSTLATGLYRLWYFGDDPFVAARLASILVLIAAFLLLAERFSRKRARYTSNGEINPIPRQKLSGIKKWLATLAVGLLVILGFFLPLFWVIRMAIYNTRHIRLEKILSASFDSLYLCLLGGGITLLCAFIMSLAERRSGRARFGWAASLGYAVPGVVIALSLLFFQKLIQENFGWRLVITGSVLGMILAYLTRFFSPAYQSIDSGFTRISPEIDMMAKSFGKSKRETLFKIFIPLLRLPIFHAFMLVAIDIFKELPASLILRPFDVTTLSITVFEFAGDDRPAEAAPYALILIVVATIGVYMLTRLQEGKYEQSKS